MMMVVMAMPVVLVAMVMIIVVVVTMIVMMMLFGVIRHLVVQPAIHVGDLRGRVIEAVHQNGSRAGLPAVSIDDQRPRIERGEPAFSAANWEASAIDCLEMISRSATATCFTAS